MIGPVLEVRHREEQWLPLRIHNSMKGSLAKLIGPGHISLKLGLAAIIICLVFFSFTSAEYRITGDAR